MSESDRRAFLRTSAAAAGAAALSVPAYARSRLSANDRIRVGLLGLGGRMQIFNQGSSQISILLFPPARMSWKGLLAGATPCCGMLLYAATQAPSDRE